MGFIALAENGKIDGRSEFVFTTHLEGLQGCRLQAVRIKPVKDSKNSFTAEGSYCFGRPQRPKAPQLKKRRHLALLRRPMPPFYSNEAFRVLEVLAPTPSFT